MLTHPSSVLTYLNMSLVKLSSDAAKNLMLFVAVKANKKTLFFTLDTMIFRMMWENILLICYLITNNHNCLSDEVTMQIVQALQSNDTLSLLKISKYAIATTMAKIELEKRKGNARKDCKT